jgi:23S rRNA (pseudouridine1915-N3)-methyltransferase
MKIRFRLGWAKGAVAAKSFKSRAAYELFAEYLKRLSYFAAAEAGGAEASKKTAGRVVRWFCHTSKDSKMLSSEQLSQALERLRQSGARELEIAIGPADGFSTGDLGERPDLLWSFGPLTLPHELAAVVAAEQLYRAFTILENHPYHSGH